MKDITLEFQNSNETHVETISINEGDKIILQFPTDEKGYSIMSKDVVGRIYEGFKEKLQKNDQVFVLPDSVKIKILQIGGKN